jgi:hypothetical protein
MARKRFIVLVEETSNANVSEFIGYLKEEKIGWWHHIKNSFLLTDTHGKTAADIRDKAKDIFGGNGTKCIVIELEGDSDTWSGFGPKRTEKVDMWKWILSSWKEH